MKSDTNEKFKNIYKKMIFSKSREERILMGFSMLKSSRDIIMSTNVDKVNSRINFFNKFYGSDYTETEKNKIIPAIKTYNSKYI